MCRTYNPRTKSWKTSGALTTPRHRAAFTTISSPSDLGILVAGGTSGVDGSSVLCSLESLNRTTNLWSTGNLAPLPECLYDSCMVELNSSYVLYIGGYDLYGYVSDHTYFYNLDTNVWTTGPNLLTRRVAHSCGIIKNSNNSDTVIVASGYNQGGRSLSSAEIYNQDLNQWEYGPKLPVAIHWGHIMPHPQEGIVLVTGAYYNGTYYLPNEIYYLPSISSNWTILSQKLSVPRYAHAVINIPSAFTEC